MKNIVILFFCLIKVNTVLSQDFKISIDKIDWADNDKSTAVLKVFYKVYNAGDISGYCDAAVNLAVISLATNDVFWSYKRDDNVFDEIRPGETLYTNAFYKIGKSTDSLYLAFIDEDGISQYKFVSTSYSKYSYGVNDKKISEYKLIADNKFAERNYNDAIKNYLICLQYDANRKKEFHPQLSKCYEYLGDESMKKYNNYVQNIFMEETLKNYNLSVSYDSSNYDVRKKLSNIYVGFGDSNFVHNNLTDAINNYIIAQKYYYTSTVKTKINNVYSR